jgi:hypothetical protein
MSDDSPRPFRGAPSGRSRETESERAQGGAYPTETGSYRTPPNDGEPPRPTSEPEGSEGAALPDPAIPSDAQTARETLTDPFTGAPMRSPDPENNQA